MATISELEQKLGGGLVFTRPDYISSGINDTEKGCSTQDKEEFKKKLLEKCGDLLKSVTDEDGFLIIKDKMYFDKKVQLKINGKYNIIGGGGQFAVLEARLFEEDLGLDAYKEIWTNMRAFEIMRADKGVVDNKPKYVQKAKEELEEEIKIRSDPEARKDIKDQKNVVDWLKWEVYERLGRKSLAVDGKIALKISYKSSREDKSVVKESYICGIVDPCAVTTMWDAKSINDRTVFFMEYIKDKLTLRETIDNLTIYEKIKLGLDIAGVLNKLNQIGIIHRDIKPDNILITKNKKGEVNAKLGDFGLIRMYKEDKSISLDKTFAEGNCVVGTPDYLSPEHVTQKSMDIRSDQYSLAGTIYSWFTGKTPNPTESMGYYDFDRNFKYVNVAKPFDKYKPIDPRKATQKEVLYNILKMQEPKPWYKEVLSFIADPFNIRKKRMIRKDFNELTLVLSRGMRYWPSERYQNMEELISDLNSIIYHKRAPYMREMLDQKVDHLKLLGSPEGRLRKTKQQEFIDGVFSRFDPFYERAMNHPIAQQHIQNQKLKYTIAACILSACSIAATYITMKYWDDAANYFKNIISSTSK